MAKELRKLAAIMFTDIVGYSAMSQENEDLALELLEMHRKMLRDIFVDFNGEEIKTIGDAFLVKFDSTLDAVNCSIAIQKELEQYNEKSPQERQVYLRIGIHVGDVVLREGDIYGDGVNISSRIEPLAQPGGICISEDVARQVKNKVTVQLEKMQKQDLKNIQLPVDIYQILLYANPKAAKAGSKQSKLAVLPFQNISPDKDTDYFSDGLTEEITMRLSGIEDLKVVSRTTSMQYKEAQKDLVTIGRELQARFILEGSVRRHLDDLRITAQLIDVETDSHLWAETYRGNMDDVFDIQENVAKKIVEALRLKLSPAEEVALTKRSTVNSEAFDVTLRGREFIFKWTKSHLLTAIDLFERAIELDPRYASAYASMSVAYILLYETHDQKEIWLEKSTEAAMKALMYDANSSDAYGALGYIYYCKNSLDEAITSLQKSLELDPDNYFSYFIRGRLYHLMNKERDAVKDFNKVLELYPDYHTAYTDLRMSYKNLGDDEKLEETIQRALKFYPSYLLRYPDDARAYMFYAIFLQLVGDLDKAKNKMMRAIDISPNDVNMIYNAACFFSQIGEKSEAVEHLKKAVTNGFGNYEYIKHDPDLDNIRKEPGYIELMKGK